MSLTKKIQKNAIKLHGQSIKTARTAYQEGYANGVQDAKQGVVEAMEFFFDRLQSLREVPGIGQKRFNDIMRHLGYLDQQKS